MPSLSEWQEAQRAKQAERGKESRREAGEGGRLGARVVNALHRADFSAPCSPLRGQQLHLFAKEFHADPFLSELLEPKGDTMQNGLATEEKRKLTKEETKAMRAKGPKKALGRAAGIAPHFVENALKGSASLTEAEIQKILALSKEEIEAHTGKSGPKQRPTPKRKPTQKVTRKSQQAKAPKKEPPSLLAAQRSHAVEVLEAEVSTRRKELEALEQALAVLRGAR